GREDAPVSELTRKLELHVAGALELLEDDLVHLGPGLHQRGSENGERATVLDVARGAKEALGRVQRRAVDTTRQDASRCRSGQVVSPAQASDAIEQDDDVLADLHEALGAFNGEFGNHGVVLSGTVKCRGDDLT